MEFANFSFDDGFLASAVSQLGNKRSRDDDKDECGLDSEECIFESTAKKISLAHEDAGIFGNLLPAREDLAMMYPGHEIPSFPALPSIDFPPHEEIKPYPFFHYKDFSIEPDLDPSAPLTPPGRVPNFPAKMHAILSRTDLQDVISWMPHGRSWRVLKPREFEVRVIPAYFEHSKYSSFIRQANGWGFRRITQGRDRNSYYHPRFLRGMPHLVKDMKRPGVSEKQAVDAEQEPDLYKISAMHPVPEKTECESIDIIHAALRRGPKARVAVCPAPSRATVGISLTRTGSMSQLTPFDQHALAAFQDSLGASELQLTKASSVSRAPYYNASKAEPLALPLSKIAPPAPLSFPLKMDSDEKASPLAMAHSMAFTNPNIAASLHPATAASQFAAGFAAATALSQQQFQAMLTSMQKQGLIPPFQQE